MKNIGLTNLDNAPHPAWKVLGDLVITAGEFKDEEITIWFKVILGPLNLPPEFTVRLIEDTQRVTRRDLANTSFSSDHLHLTVYVPKRKMPDGKTWGFFHTARNGADHRTAGSRSHLIDYYLFIEGS
jgi:hypothetical protein